MTSSRSKDTKPGEPVQVEQLKKLQAAGLLEGLTVEALEALLDEVEVAAEREHEADPYGDEDPRNYEDRWLDHAFYLYLVEAGPAEGALTSSVSPADLTSLLAGKGPAKIEFAESHDPRGGRKIQVSFPGASRTLVEVLWGSAAELAGVANFALARASDPRRFVECQVDPRFALAAPETIYLLATFDQRQALVDQGVIRDDEEISDVVEPISGPPQSVLQVTGVGWKGTRMLELSVLAMPRGGKWHIQGSFDPTPPGPIATNLSGDAYARLYEIRGWRPSPNPTRPTFRTEWEMDPGILAAILDGGDDADSAPDLVRAALDDLKQAAKSSGIGTPSAPIRSTDVIVATALIGDAHLLVRRSAGATAIVVRDGDALEPGEEPMQLEPGDTVVLGSGLGSVTRKELLTAVEQVETYYEGPVELLLARAVERGAVRPALLIAQVALKQRSQ